MLLLGAGIFFFLILVYCLVCALIYIFQVRFLFQGQALAKNFQFTPFEGMQEVSLASDQGLLSALHYQNSSPKGLMFFLHGNVGNLDIWVPDVDYYKKNQIDLFMLDYRGFGKSDGRIASQQQVEQDVWQAWQYIAPRYQDKKLPIMIYGRSMGSYFATWLATKVTHDLLVLVSPYSSMRALIKQKLPWLPLLLLRFPLRTDLLLPQVEGRVEILHGHADTLIPLSHAQTLLTLMQTRQDQQLNQTVYLTTVEGAAHGDVHEFAQYKQRMDELAASL